MLSGLARVIRAQAAHSFLVMVLISTACGGDGAGYDASQETDASCVIACSPTEQNVCRDSERCTYQHRDGGWLGPTCVEGSGSIPLGGECAATPGEFDDCVRGSLCFGGVCAPFCEALYTPCTQGFCSRVGSACFWPAVCTAPCEPLSPVCAAGESCYLSPSPTTDGPGCAATGSVEPGQPCDPYLDRCTDGHTCVLTPSWDRVCAKICAVGGDPGPTCEDQVCEEYADASTGVCVPAS